jgi:SAM-dependent methyltransferase
MVDREGILDSAKYLRNVRPLDPAELSEYVDPPAHPAVVERILHEAALDLGIVKQDDGTYVPVPEDPIPVGDVTVDALPDAYARILEEALVDQFGPDWHTGESGRELRSTIRTLKDDYFQQRDVVYDETTALAYAIYHLPAYYAAIHYVLADLTDKHLLDRRLRVLDVGAGVGGPALGVHDFLPDDALVEYHALEPSANADLLADFLDATTPNFHTTIHRETAEDFDPDTYDLVILANVLNELESPDAVAAKYLDALAPDGSLVALAPADENTATGLRAVERTLVADHDATVYSPTVRLWPGQEPSDRGWTFDVEPDLETPGFQAELDDATPADDDEHDPGEFRNVDVQYAYSILRTDDTRRVDVTANADRFATFAETETHVPNRINAIAIKLSHDLTDSPDANPLYKIGDGSQATDHYAVRTHPTALNESLDTADYGDLLTFENVLALWNEDEDAYNLVVDADTTVDHAPAPI